MPVQRFFVPAAAFEQQPIVLAGEQAHQVRRVLRMRLGDRVTLLDNQGWAYEAILIAYGGDDVKFQTVRRWEPAGEPCVHLTLFQAVLKGEHFAWALQKGTEAGISAFVPIVCERNVVDDLDAIEQKRPRWERIIQEAAEQCGRARIPKLWPAQLFRQALQPGGEEDVAAEDVIRLIPWEGAHETRLSETLAECNLEPGTRIQLYVGPEGGFAEEEVLLARRYGVRPVGLGSRILRAETAGIVAATAILYEAGDI